LLTGVVTSKKLKHTHFQNNDNPQSLSHSSLSHCGQTKSTTTDKIAFRAKHDTHHSQGVNKSGND